MTTSLAPTEPAAPYRLRPSAVAASLDVDPETGLTTAEADRRHADVGPNAIRDTPPPPAWRRFLHQFTDRLIVVLLVAAAIAWFVSGDAKTPIVVLVVVLLNAVIGFVQEQRAGRAIAALRGMVVHRAVVRRDGRVASIEAERLVPGDVVLVEAGDRVPADGRLAEAVKLEADESILTGESQPAPKSTDAVDGGGAVGDRSCMVHMSTTITRGRGEMIVTATGERTELGRIAGMLAATERERTPLQRQLDALASALAKLAGVIVAAVIVIGLLRGSSLSDMLLTGVALAVAAIPEGLPAVTVVTLAIGVARLAEQHAIMRQLPAVETLGSATVICSDKTGTLTVNQMTAVAIVAQGRRFEVTGVGYEPIGEIVAPGGGPLTVDEQAAIDAVLTSAVLCNDANLTRTPDGWTHTGDPTELALLVPAAKFGVDIAAVRQAAPRLAEMPFDSATKLMATVNRHGDAVRLHVKGAPDVIAARARGGAGLHDEVERLAAQGLRVLAVAWRDLDIATARTVAGGEVEVTDVLDDLTVAGLVGLLDPPRPEARTAIAEAQRAGIDVKMITGDHATTAASIAGSLGIRGGVVTGAELDALDDIALDERLPDAGVFARVSPEHKLRLVGALQRRGEIVSMTGDGVNDAPALKRSDIGVAMGITGTEVSKQAASMILADDNFATIVGAVRRGRTIYDNVVKFVRFQLSTTIGFAAVFLAAGLFGIADGKPFSAIAILWVNLVMDGPPAMALGVDPSATDVMRRGPRRSNEPIVDRRRWTAVGLAALTSAAGTIGVLVLAPGDAPAGGTASVAGTMAFTTFVLFQFFNLLNVRSDRTSVFHRDTLRNRWLWLSLGTVAVLQVLVTAVGPLQRLFDTTSLSVAQWLVAVLVASSVVWVEELRKLAVRHRSNRQEMQ